MKATLAVVVALFWAVSPSATITIDTVPVGDVGNPGDPFTRFYGTVNHAYSIGKYEVTVGQYTAFLNAVAASDTYGLYSPYMPLYPDAAGIVQSGASGSYTYSAISSPNQPVTLVSFGDAARFANWLNNGQPSGAQTAATTEDGAYTLNGATSDAALSAVARNSNAKWFIPSENEWYKAAYYQPSAKGGDADSYWKYPMRTNSLPYSDQPPGATPDNTRVGNFYKNDGVANGYDDGYAVTGSTSFSTKGQNFRTDVGAYTSSPSFYGSFDQGGNVAELNETLINDWVPMRGGPWGGDVNSLSASNRRTTSQTREYGDVGFRVATIVPEPSAIALVGLTAVARVCFLRRRLPRSTR